MSEWFEKSFSNDYLLVYKHRDMQGAREEAVRMMGWLRLAPGSEVFDLCCGMGRHSMALADFGYRVTGMDLSDVLLAEAERINPDGKVRFFKGDMRDIPAIGPFDAVVNLFTSFGYFKDDQDSVRVLNGIRRVLKPGGRFILDYLNASYVTRHLVPRSEREEGSVHIIEERSIEDGFVRKRITIREQEQPERHYLEQVKLYGLDDFKSLLSQAGLRLDQTFGNYAGDAYRELESPRLIFIGHKEIV